MLRTLLFTVALTVGFGWPGGRHFVPSAGAQLCPFVGACGDGACDCGENDQTCPQDCAAPDAFFCYDVTVSKKAPKFTPITGIPVTDVFESLPFSATLPREVCNPVTGAEHDHVQSWVTTDPLSPTHFERYAVSAAKGAKHNLQKNVEVDTNFGSFRVDFLTDDKLMVPAAKGIDAVPPALETVDVDHYHCYDVALHKGTKFPKGLVVTVLDEFSSQGRTYGFTKLDHVCPVAQKYDEPVLDPCAALACFDVKLAKGSPKLVPPKNVYTVDQFGTVRQDVKVEDDLCVPATIRNGDGSPACLPSTTSTSTTSTTNTTATTATTSSTSTSTSTSSTTSTTAPSCAGNFCGADAECTSGVCAPLPIPVPIGICVAVCADPSSTCVCGGDCTSGFCNDSGGSPGHCAPVCAGPSTTCVCGGDCTSGFCNDSGGSPGFCAPVSAGGQCSCGGDCTSQNCQGGSCQANAAGGACQFGNDCTSGFCNGDTCAAVSAGGQCTFGGDCTSQNCQGGTCQPNCAGGACQFGGDCTSGFCDGGVCQQVYDGGSCVCGGDCVSGFCDDSGGPGVCVGP